MSKRKKVEAWACVSTVDGTLLGVRTKRDAAVGYSIRLTEPGPEAEDNARIARAARRWAKRQADLKFAPFQAHDKKLFRAIERADKRRKKRKGKKK